ncbi:hypothetical protein DMB66_59055 [Actinoplanes sp. ATCC 53533]|nr:hypothetical protein DMB66_59055 [Actinoplanes sp. ATCC 53533]
MFARRCGSPRRSTNSPAQSDPDRGDLQRDYGSRNATAPTGLTQLGARLYDPILGGFISTDALLDLSKPEHLNPYAYGFHNPILLSDPTGTLPDVVVDGLITRRRSPKSRTPAARARARPSLRGSRPGRRAWRRRSRTSRRNTTPRSTTCLCNCVRWPCRTSRTSPARSSRAGA